MLESGPLEDDNIPRFADKILDAPDLQDEFYLNVLDWSCLNVLAVGLGKSVFLWNGDTGATIEMMNLEETANDENEYIASVAWAVDGKHLAVGLSNSEVHIWHTSPCRQLRRLRGHSERVSSLSWNKSLLSSGSRDGSVINHDVRVQQHITSCLIAHCQEVCGLRWSTSGRHLASGGNDNLLYIWDLAAVTTPPPAAEVDLFNTVTKYLHRLDGHTAAVKAISWCPFQSSLVASGGGTGDGSIRFWNSFTGACTATVSTGAQVSSLLWSSKRREILSGHGFDANNLNVWEYPSLAKVAELKGHSGRILHMAVSPDGCTVASAAADETIRFWNVFYSPPKKRQNRSRDNEDNNQQCSKMRCRTIR